MARYIGVRIERAPRPFAEVVRVGGRSAGTKRLTTIVPAQQIAEIELYLLRSSRRKPNAVEPLRELHRFRVPVSGGSSNSRRSGQTPGSPAGDESTERSETVSQPVFDLAITRSRGRRYTATVTEAGRLRDAAEITVPLRIGRIVTITLLLLLLLLGVWGGSTLLRVARNGDQSIERTASREASDATSSDNSPPEAAAPATDAPSTAAPSTAAPVAAAPVAAAPSTDAPASTEERRTAPAETPEAPERSPAIPHGRIEATVYFGPDNVELTPRGIRVLSELVSELEPHTVVSVVVEGHTALFGNEAGREMISVGRIEAVTQYLESYVTLDEETLETHVVGALEPVTTATAQQELNRRAEVFVTFRRDER